MPDLFYYIDTMPDEYSIKTDVFEGPLELLLSLVEKRKLFISDISLSQVADDYISYIKQLENFPIADSAHFILIASTLVLIKSKSLLPNLSLSDEEEKNIDELEARLRQYQKYKELSNYIREMFGSKMSFGRLPNKFDKVVFAPDSKTTVARLVSAIRDTIANMPKLEEVPRAIIKKVISLEDTISNLTDRITKSLKMSFKDFSKIGKADKVNVIVSFLAMLELVKQGIISVRQDRNFHDIEMESHSVGVPKY